MKQYIYIHYFISEFVTNNALFNKYNSNKLNCYTCIINIYLTSIPLQHINIIEQTKNIIKKIRAPDALSESLLNIMLISWGVIVY